MNDRVKPTVTINMSTMTVIRAFDMEYSFNAFASTPALDEQTIRVTIGSNQAVVICSSECV